MSALYHFVIASASPRLFTYREFLDYRNMIPRGITNRSGFASQPNIFSHNFAASQIMSDTNLFLVLLLLLLIGCLLVLVIRLYLLKRPRQIFYTDGVSVGTPPHGVQMYSFQKNEAGLPCYINKAYHHQDHVI
ncbi:unnamed protein product, partial [Mesorhabditis spiculigera]